MRFFLLSCLLFPTLTARSQEMVGPLPAKLEITDQVPDGLLAKRSCVFYTGVANEELETIQGSFQNTGVDAVAYFKSALVFAGADVTQKIAGFLAGREIAFIILVSKKGNAYSFVFTAFNGTERFVDNGQPGWEVQSPDLNEALQAIYRLAVNSQPVKNLLINSYPEKDFPINIIDGRRSDFFAIDLKVDRLAVPWFKDAAADSLLARFFKDHYPFGYGMTEPGTSPTELRNNGYQYVMAYVHTEGAIARELLGYPEVPNESALTSVTYPNGSVELKTIPATTPVYKFYFKHLVSGNVYLGTKWDADTTWLGALRNHIKGFKAELKIP